MLMLFIEQAHLARAGSMLVTPHLDQDTLTSVFTSSQTVENKTVCKFCSKQDLFCYSE